MKRTCLWFHEYSEENFQQFKENKIQFMRITSRANFLVIRAYSRKKVCFYDTKKYEILLSEFPFGFILNSNNKGV